MFLLQTPVVQEMPHDDHIDGRQRVAKEVSTDKAQPTNLSERNPPQNAASLDFQAS